MSLEVSKYLRSILTMLHKEIAPEIGDNFKKHRLEVALMVLSRIIVDLESEDKTLYLAQLGTAAGDDKAENLEELRDAVASRLRMAVDNDGALALDLARMIADAEKAVRISRESAILDLRASLDAERTSTDDLVVPEQAFTEYLRGRFGNREIEVADIRPVPGGRSKGTILFTLVEGGQRQELVIRKDFPKNFMGSSVTDEFPIIRAAFDAGVTVPEPLWLENDNSVLGGKFIVFRRVAGRAAGTMFEIDAAPDVIRDYARQIARLHAMDAGAAGLRNQIPFGTGAFPVEAMVQESYAKHRKNTPSDALLEAAHVWMIQNLGCVERGHALVHGDAGFHNVLCEGDRMTALLDWELVHAGDPAEDLMKCKAAACQVIPWSEFMAIYQESGGRALSPEREKFFTIWRLVNFALFAADARAMFESGEEPDVRLAAVGYNTFNRLQEALARELAEI